MSTRRLFLPSMFLAVIGAAGCTTEAENPPSAGPTYYGELKALVDERCVGCHSEGGIAPFSLATYDDVVENAAAVRAAVESGSMPPWLAEDGCNDYVNDRSLTDLEKTSLIDWIDRGAPAGAPDTDDSEDDGHSAAGLSRVDRTLTMPTEYTPQLQPDDYRCFLVDWPGDDTEFVTGFRANPGNPAIVHHVIAFLIPPGSVEKYQALDEEEEGPGYTCFGGAGGGLDLDTSFIGSWAPGAEGGDFPSGTGIRVEPGSKIALQVHYNTLNGGDVPDRSSIDLKVDETVDKEASWQFFTSLAWVVGDGMDIPPMSQDVEHAYSVDPTAFVSKGKPFLIHSVGLHMHTFGQTARLSIERAREEGESGRATSADGDEECLLSIPEWNFHWQLSYRLEQPVEVRPGDRLSIDCTWDNPTKDTIRWGEGTGDEMCLGLVYITDR